MILKGRFLVIPVLYKKQRHRTKVSHFSFLFFSSQFFKTGFLCVTLTILKLALYTKPASNTYSSTCLCRPNAGTEGMHHHAQWYVRIATAGSPATIPHHETAEILVLRSHPHSAVPHHSPFALSKLASKQ